jgi:hypothetical protein
VRKENISVDNCPKQVRHEILGAIMRRQSVTVENSLAFKAQITPIVVRAGGVNTRKFVYP